MNERIRELAEQACITIVPEPFDDASRSWNNTMEKFAQLIVAECVGVAMRSVDDNEPKEAWYLIKEHFGVDE